MTTFSINSNHDEKSQAWPTLMKVAWTDFFLCGCVISEKMNNFGYWWFVKGKFLYARCVRWVVLNVKVIWIVDNLNKICDEIFSSRTSLILSRIVVGEFGHFWIGRFLSKFLTPRKVGIMWIRRIYPGRRRKSYNFSVGLWVWWLDVICVSFFIRKALRFDCQSLFIHRWCERFFCYFLFSIKALLT